MRRNQNDSIPLCRIHKMRQSMNVIEGFPYIRSGIAANPFTRNGEDTIMKAFTQIFALAVLAVLFAGGVSHAETAYAIPLTGITIDGKLGDWPKDMINYPIVNNGRFYGPTDIDDADLVTSPDLSPKFMVGYDPERNLIYLAVQIRDDSLKVSMIDPWHTDACEVYVDGGNRGKTMSVNNATKAEDLPSLQYVLCPPGGGYGAHLLSGDQSANPNLKSGDIAKTKTSGAYSRIGDISACEWAIEAFDHYPDSPTRLEVGKAIGFDVVAVDKDSDTDTPAWICWGPIAGMKAFNADKLGKLVFLTSYTDLGEIAGTVTRAGEKTVYPGCIIDICIGDQVAGSVTTDAQGKFMLRLLPGQYSVRPRPGRGIEAPKEILYSVTAGKQTTADVTLSPIKLPEALVRSMARYKSFKGYRDTTTVVMRMVRPGMDNQMTSQILFAFGRPTRIRIESITDTPFSGVSIFSNGGKLVSYIGTLKQYTEEDAPEVLTSGTLKMAQMPCFAEDIILSNDPLKDLTKGIEEVETIGTENLDGIPTTIIELTQ